MDPSKTPILEPTFPVQTKHEPQTEQYLNMKNFDGPPPPPPPQPSSFFTVHKRHETHREHPNVRTSNEKFEKYFSLPFERSFKKTKTEKEEDSAHFYRVPDTTKNRRENESVLISEQDKLEVFAFFRKNRKTVGRIIRKKEQIKIPEIFSHHEPNESYDELIIGERFLQLISFENGQTQWKEGIKITDIISAKSILERIEDWE